MTVLKFCAYPIPVGCIIIIVVSIYWIGLAVWKIDGKGFWKRCMGDTDVVLCSFNLVACCMDAWIGNAKSGFW